MCYEIDTQSFGRSFSIELPYSISIFIVLYTKGLYVEPLKVQSHRFIIDYLNN